MTTAGPGEPAAAVKGEPPVVTPRHEVGPQVAPTRPWALYLALAWLATIVLAAVFADVLPLKDPAKLGTPAFQAPGLRAEFLGTDELGRSVLSRAIYGARVSLVVGMVATGLALTVGGVIGMVWGYVPGKLDSILTILTDTVLAFPPLILLVAAAAVLTPNTRNLALMLGVLVVPAFVRLARAATLVTASKEYVLAAKTIGARHRRIIFREIMPTVVVSLMAYALIVAASLIVAEGSLSFLGLGIRPPDPSWGGMIAKGRDRLQAEPHLVFVPAIFLFATVLALNTVGEWARGKVQLKESVV